MSLTSLTVVLAAALGGAAPGLDPLDIKAAPIGMSLATWKASPFPGPPSTRIEPLCTDRPGIAALLPTTAGTSPSTAVCGYFGRYGRFLLPEAVSVSPRLVATRARYIFVAGHLQSIDYRFSVNVYDDLTARLNKLYGAPLSVVRDTVKTEVGVNPRVRLTWITPKGEVELIDPVPPYTELSIKLTGEIRPNHGLPS